MLGSALWLPLTQEPEPPTESPAFLRLGLDTHPHLHSRARRSRFDMTDRQSASRPSRAPSDDPLFAASSRIRQAWIGRDRTGQVVGCLTLALSRASVCVLRERALLELGRQSVIRLQPMTCPEGYSAAERGSSIDRAKMLDARQGESIDGQPPTTGVC